MQFIINGDDFGLSEEVNRAVADCFALGLIDRTTLLVNMPLSGAARELAASRGFFGRVGLHINLVEGRPLTARCQENPVLCDENGLFAGRFHRGLAGRLFLDRGTRAAIREEAQAQIQRYLDWGFPLRHADSHQYVHTYPSAARELLPLLRRYGFRSVRLSRNLPGNDLSLPFAAYKKLFNRLLAARGLAGSRWFGSLEDWLNSPRRDRPGSCELMVHPVYRDGVLYDDTLPHPKPFFTAAFLEERGICHGLP